MYKNDQGILILQSTPIASATRPSGPMCKTTGMAPVHGIPTLHGGVDRAPLLMSGRMSHIPSLWSVLVRSRERWLLILTAGYFFLSSCRLIWFSTISA